MILFFVMSSCTDIYKESLEKVKSAMVEKDYETALNLFSEIITDSIAGDEIYNVYYGRALCYFELNDLRRAKLDIKEAFKINIDNEGYKDLKGKSLWLSARISVIEGKREEALRKFKKATAYMKTSPLYSTIGYQEMKLNRYNDALMSLNKAIHLDSKNAYAYNNRALVFLELSKLIRARKDIIKSIELDPDNPYVYKHSALIFIEKEQFNLACEDLYKARDLGYATFSQDGDSEEVQELIDRYCNPEDFIETR